MESFKVKISNCDFRPKSRVYVVWVLLGFEGYYNINSMLIKLKPWRKTTLICKHCIYLFKTKYLKIWFHGTEI